MLDRLPPVVRHLLILLLPVVLGWIGSDVVPALQERTGWAYAAGAALSALVLILTPLTRQYGVGTGDPAPGADTGTSGPENGA